MRIGIDAREIQDGVYTGIGRALYNFLHYFSEASHKDICVLFSTKPVAFKLSDKIENHVMEEASTFWWDQVQLPIAIRNEDIEIFYSPYYKIPVFAPCKKVCAMLDIMYLQFPPYHDELSLPQTLYYRIIGGQFVAAADRILTCSLYSRDDIMKVYNVSRKKIDIVPLSVSEAYRPEDDPAKMLAAKNEYGISGRYILYVGNFKLHKNVEILIESFALLARDFPDVALVLVAPQEHLYQILDTLAVELGLSGRVIFAGKITDADRLRTLYSGAEVFVMPSLYEGFGLPVVEAMACGAPVVSSNATSLPEVLGEAAVLVDPTDREAMAGAIRKVMSDKVFKGTLIGKGLARVRLFREEDIAKKFYDFLRNAV